MNSALMKFTQCSTYKTIKNHNDGEFNFIVSIINVYDFLSIEIIIWN